MYSAFTPSHRRGTRPALVCLHGFCDTWRTWELVLPKLLPRVRTCAHRLVRRQIAVTAAGVKRYAVVCELCGRHLGRS